MKKINYALISFFALAALLLIGSFAILNQQLYLYGRGAEHNENENMPSPTPRSADLAFVDFSSPIGTMRMSYGANEDDNWMAFADDSRIQELHTEVESDYIRVWASSQSYRESTIALLDDGSYDFESLDKFITAVLRSDAIPFVVFAHAPGTFGEGHGNSPPESDTQFAQYVGAVVEHYARLCSQKQLASDCDVNQWYFEIWNEPYLESWWKGTPARYSTLFNEAYARIKQIAPQAKVGGFSGVFGFTRKDREHLRKFLEGSDPDFVTIHHYGNLLHNTEKAKMLDVKYISYDSILALAAFLNKYSIDQRIEIIEGEYNSDNRQSFATYFDEPMTAAWYASALIWHIKSQQISIEMFYSGTALTVDQGFGMWSYNRDFSLRPWPVYVMKKYFVQYNTKGSAIFETTETESMDILAVENDQGRFITLVDKMRKSTPREILVKGGTFRKLVDMKTNEALPIVDGIATVHLDPYEMRIFAVE